MFAAKLCTERTRAHVELGSPWSRAFLCAILTKYGISPTRDFVDLDLTYNENSNILTIQDNVSTTNGTRGTRLFDLEIGLDDPNRVVQVTACRSEQLFFLAFLFSSSLRRASDTSAS